MSKKIRVVVVDDSALGSSSRIGSGCARAMCEVKSTHVEQLWPEQGALRRWAEGIGP